MSLVSYEGLVELVKANVITAELEDINSASIDLTLGDEIMVERRHVVDPSYVGQDTGFPVIDISQKETLRMDKITIPEDGYVLLPGEFILATTANVFNLPDGTGIDIGTGMGYSGEYKLKSSMARVGLEHLNAGWADAGWHGSHLTLELKNMSQYHGLKIRAGMKIGQFVVFEHEAIPKDRSYAARGRYNKQNGVTAGKGVE